MSRVTRWTAAGAAVIMAGGTLVGSPMAAAATPVATWAQLVTAVAAGGEVTLTADITQAAGHLDLTNAVPVTLDLNGRRLSITVGDSLQAAVGVPVGGSLTVTDSIGTGVLTAMANSGAAIGGDHAAGTGPITIRGGTVVAESDTGAAIGGGENGVSGPITITGGTVTATAKDGGAGIGLGNRIWSGLMLSSGVIRIEGGVVSATGGEDGAGIGGGAGSTNGEITITGGTVTATGIDSGAGIGSGRNLKTLHPAPPTGGSITISGGTVTAIGGLRAAGIGTGSEMAGGPVTIQGGTVTATGGVFGAGIGGGLDATVGVVTIRAGASVTANGYSAVGAVSSGSGGSFVNEGSLNIPAGSQLTIRPDAPATNSGVINLHGTLNGPGTLVNSGTIRLLGGTVVGGGVGNGTVAVTQHNHRLIFDLNGGPGATPAPLPVFARRLNDAGLTLPAVPAGGAYTFTGWFTNVTAGTQVTGMTDLLELAGAGPVDVRLYAHYSITQAITFTTTAPSAAAVGGTYQAAATGGGSGNPVVITSATPAVCTVSGATVSLQRTGTCTLRANQAGGGFYQAAPQQTQTFSIGKASQAITFTSTPPSAPLVGGTYQVTATGGASGLPVVFSSGTSGVCTVTGSVVSFDHAGICEVRANQGGNDDYTAAPQQTQSITVGKADQTVTFSSTPPAQIVVRGAYQVAASSTAGLPVTVTSGTPAVCTVSGATVTFDHAGTCQVHADQAGTADINAAPRVTQSFTVGKAPQSVTFTSTPPAAAAVGATYAVAATGGPSGLPVTLASITPAVCSLSGSTTTFLTAGTCTVAADQAGNDDYTAAPRQTQTIAVGPGAQTITFTSTPPAAPVVGSSYTVSATGGPSGLPVRFGSGTASVCTVTGTTVTVEHVGRCVVTADQDGNANYTAASTVTQEVDVLPAPQTIVITGVLPGTPVVGDRHTITATGGPSGTPVVLGTTTADVCTVIGTEVIFDHVGECVITADQAGTTDYLAAPRVTRSTTVGQAPQSVHFTSTAPTSAVVGDVYQVSAVSGSAGDAVLEALAARVAASSAADSGNPVVFSTPTDSVCSVSGSTVTFEHTGECVIAADQAGGDDHLPAPTVAQTVTVGPAPQEITFTTAAARTPRVGGNHQVAAIGGPSGNEVTFSSATPQVCTVTEAVVFFEHAGECVIDADQQGNDDYLAAPTRSQQITVGKAPQTVEFTSPVTAAPRAGDRYPATAIGGPSGEPVLITVDPAGAPGVCRMDGDQVLFTGAGVCSLRADQAGTDDYLSGSAFQQVTVAAGEVVVPTGELPAAVADRPYQAYIPADGGLGPYTWTVLRGELPPGLTLNPETGEISGTPTRPGSYTFTVGVTDSEEPPVTTEQEFTIVVAAEPAAPVPAAPAPSVPALPATGVDPGPLVLTSLLLLLAGGALLWFSARRSALHRLGA